MATNYVALRGALYWYSLRAYGPKDQKKAEDKHRLIKSTAGDFWDFRLEAEYMQRSSRHSQLKTSQLTNNLSSRRIPCSIGFSVGHNYIVADSEASIFYPEVGIQAIVP
ncbi:hypothetical protein LBE40_00860 [Bartonella taylorii]|uniref:Uncharacterized protein n=1 Tax=Bartonella taylorii 8TBB TaxID=1094560 RepID=A0A9P2W214_BARTA|nr:hypothetical protein [Bartonella taylorii]EJF92816.1 hypothetical protein ME9_01519 [Bartonella taylorii 8TBB]USP01416.1 hypothetical protein LBE40_00860 [Bartonella taylorii]